MSSVETLPNGDQFIKIKADSLFAQQQKNYLYKELSNLVGKDKAMILTSAVERNSMFGELLEVDQELSFQLGNVSGHDEWFFQHDFVTVSPDGNVSRRGTGGNKLEGMFKSRYGHLLPEGVNQENTNMTPN